MPISADSFDQVTLAAMEALKPSRILDIGCGAGKYGRMIRSILPEAIIEGVEVEPRYIEQFALRDIYAPMHLMSATSIPERMIDEMFDLTIIGDCIEHLPKSAGLDLLNFLTYRSAYTIVVLPESMMQNTVDNIKSEAHISAWSERDFQWHDNWAWAQVYAMQFYILRGYPPASVNLQSLLNTLDARQFTLRYDTVTTPLKFNHTNLTKTVPLEEGGAIYWRAQ
ncbi:Trans-aconitate 2-methyltransferase [Caballeronia arvi]|uniref:Trans-aconitate 2-methyltransferase n=1 Tax=Caballeronia arvi TaxID=1777135 RepID=A0A158HTX7_9BURK|nr:class I SAM-dependent methyltransferase [Caballeronia arvi]SAL47834.1 Trans-aconitate 2-methyltransferase [Caballeronia arvi]